MQTLRSMGMAAHLHDVPGSTKRGQWRHVIDLELPRTTGTAYSPSCAWEKLWQETGPRSYECSWQAVYSPRTTGWAPSCFHPLLTLSCPPHCLLYPELPVSPIVYFHWQGVPSSLLHSHVPCFALNHIPRLSFLPVPPNSFFCHFPSHQTCSFSTCRHFLVKLCLSFYYELLPFLPASWLTEPVAGNQGKQVNNILSLLSSFHLALQPLQAYEEDTLRKLRYLNDFILCLWHKKKIKKSLPQ